MLAHFTRTREELLRRADDLLNGIREEWLGLHIDKGFLLSNAAEAHRRMENRESTGKIILQTASKWTAKRVVDYCNGWIAIDGPTDIAPALEAVRAEASRVGRSLKEFDLSILTWSAFPGVSEGEAHLRNLHQLGFNRIMFVLTPAVPEIQWPVLEQHANLIRAFC